MDIIVEFTGGAMDGTTFCSDSPDHWSRTKAIRMGQVIGGCLRDKERREVALDPGLTYSFASPDVRERAERESWSEARIKAVMPYYVYVYAGHREEDGIAHISMKFKEVDG